MKVRTKEITRLFFLTCLLAAGGLYTSLFAQEKGADGREIFNVVEEMPRFPGCEVVDTIITIDPDTYVETVQVVEKMGEAQRQCAQEKLFEFIFSNLRYPEAAKKAGIEGTVVAQFVVEADGRITGLKVVRDIGAGAGEEVLRVLGQMPEWIPGRQLGKKVAVRFNLPVQFRLNGEGASETKTDLPEVSEEEVFKVVEEMPRFPGCEELGEAEKRQQCAMEALIRFITENLRYPESARETRAEGAVVLRFVVDKEGRPVDPGIARSAGAAFDEEVLRVFHLMPDWIAGRQRGREVNVQMMLPVQFRFAEEKDKDEAAHRLELEDYRLAPNPATERVELRFRAAAGPILVSITDLNGRRVYRTYLRDFDGLFQDQIDLSQAPKGTLLLQIRQGNKVFSEQVIRK